MNQCYRLAMFHHAILTASIMIKTVTVVIKKIAGYEVSNPFILFRRIYLSRRSCNEKR